MGKVLLLPRTPEQLVAVQRAYPAEVYPDFAARLHLWRQRDAERRERFRRDMAIILFDASLNLAHPRTPDGVYVWQVEPPQEGA